MTPSIEDPGKSIVAMNVGYPFQSVAFTFTSVACGMENGVISNFMKSASLSTSTIVTNMGAALPLVTFGVKMVYQKV